MQALRVTPGGRELLDSKVVTIHKRQFGYLTHQCEGPEGARLRALTGGPV